MDIIYRSTDFIPYDLGLRDFKEGIKSLKISAPERAHLEDLYLLGTHFFWYMNATKTMDHLEGDSWCFFDTRVIRKLHLNQNQKVFLCFAEYLNLPWRKNLDISKIYLGKGYHTIANPVSQRKSIIWYFQSNFYVLR